MAPAVDGMNEACAGDGMLAGNVRLNRREIFRPCVLQQKVNNPSMLV